MRIFVDEGRGRADVFVASDGLSAEEIADISEDRGTRRVVDLDAVTRNYKRAIAMAGKPLIAVVKARAYGAGMVPIARRLAAEGCGAFAVATLGSALVLREALGEGPMILVLGYTPPGGLAKAAAARVSLTLTDDDDLFPRYEAEIAARDIEDVVLFHLNIDTGMTRVGVPTYAPDRIDRAADQIRDAPWARLEGAYTHFPRAENRRANTPDDAAFTLGQIEAFGASVARLRERGHDLAFVHLANSPAIEQYRDEAVSPEWVTHARAGSLLHGMSLGDGFERASRWETVLIRVERLGADAGVGYGVGYRAKAGQTIGTLPVGYADGYLPASKGSFNQVRVGDVLAPVVSLAMDMCMVDLTAYIDKHRRPPEVVSTPVVLISAERPPAPLSAELVAARWGLEWPVALAGIRTRNARVYQTSPAAG